jgi:hypothetical protein
MDAQELLGQFLAVHPGADTAGENEPDIHR